MQISKCQWILDDIYRARETHTNTHTHIGSCSGQSVTVLIPACTGFSARVIPTGKKEASYPFNGLRLCTYPSI